MTREQALQTLRKGGKIFDLAKALQTLTDDPASSPEDIVLALDHKGFVAEQAAFALYERTNTPLPADRDSLVLDRDEWVRRLASLDAQGSEPQASPATLPQAVLARARKEAEHVLHDRQKVPHAALVRAIEERLSCRIFFIPANEAPFRGSGTASTRSRRVWHRVEWPEKREFTVWEHWVFFDSSLDAHRAAIAIAYELGHILLHLGRDPSASCTRASSDGTILYTSSEEAEAHAFVSRLVGSQKSTASLRGLSPEELTAEVTEARSLGRHAPGLPDDLQVVPPKRSVIK